MKEYIKNQPVKKLVAEKLTEGSEQEILQWILDAGKKAEFVMINNKRHLKIEHKSHNDYVKYGDYVTVGDTTTFHPYPADTFEKNYSEVSDDKTDKAQGTLADPNASVLANKPL